MAITSGLCASFKEELFEAVHNFSTSGGDTYKLALYTSAANLGPATTTYTATDEVVGSGYNGGGVTLTNAGTYSNASEAWVDFQDVTFANSTITARGALIYNSTQSNKAVAVIDFGTDQTTTNSNFTIQFPAAGAGTAIVRIT